MNHCPADKVCTLGVRENTGNRESVKIKRRFKKMARLFGTDGVRGVAGTELTIDLAMKLGQAGAYVLTKTKSHQPTIIVGCDTRISGGMLANALMAGICSVGANAIYVGVIPTPAIAYLTRKHKVDAGVVISASHNPMEFNGIKFFNGDGYKLSDELEDEIEALIKSGMEGVEFPIGPGIGKVEYRFDIRDEYVEFQKKTVPVDLSSLKIVVDCAEGASYYTSVKTLEELGANLISIHTKPDGTNINANCGSTHMDELRARVVLEKADIGIAFDGDADRMLAVDETGTLVDGDQIMAICGNFMKQQGKLAQNTIVVTVMTNLGFSIMGKEQGIHIENTKVGDRYVLENMLENGYNLGGEQSGHVIFLDDNTTGDGLLSALHLLQVMVETKKPLSELAKIMEVLPQALVNAKVPNHKKESYMEYTEIAEAIADLEAKFAGEGRVLIRPSGTEPLVRVMIEGKDQKVIDEEAAKLAELIEKVML
jgi:phosphoglucosamine mutase